MPLQDLLKQIMSIKYADKTSWEREKMMEDRLEGDIPQDEAQLVLQSMNDKEASAAISAKIKSLLEAKTAKLSAAAAAPPLSARRVALTYQEFVEAILSVHLVRHEEKIKEHVECFRGFDKEAKVHLYRRTLTPRVEPESLIHRTPTDVHSSCSA